MVRLFWFLAAALALAIAALAIPAHASGVVSYKFGAPASITGVALNNEYFTGTVSTGTTVGTLTVQTTGQTFAGTLAMSGAAASSFSLTGTTLKAAATLSPGVAYPLIFTPTQAGIQNSGHPFAIEVYGSQDWYISPTGSDSNSGTSSGSPWLTPNHAAVHCTDKLHAPGGTYSPSQFDYIDWPDVPCPNNDAVAWVWCDTPFACYAAGNVGGRSTFTVAGNYWGVYGWHVQDLSGAYGGCIFALPRADHVIVHHLAIFNNYCDGAVGDGIGSAANAIDQSSGGADYMMVGYNIVWNAAQSSVLCYSGISIAAPVQIDGAPGPHFLVMGNFSNDNVDGNGCATGGGGGGETDGSGIIFDRWDVFAYTQLAVVQNNWVAYNGGIGFHINTQSQTGPNLLFRNNTSYGNNTDPNECAYGAGDSTFGWVPSGSIIGNLFVTTISQKCTNFPIFAISTNSYSTRTLIVDNNFLVSPGATYQIYWDGPITCLNGTVGANPGSNNNTTVGCPQTITGQNPSFPNVADPGEVNCTGQPTTLACEAALISGFTPANANAVPYSFTTLAPHDANDDTPFFRNVFHQMPSALNPYGY